MHIGILFSRNPLSIWNEHAWYRYRLDPNRITAKTRLASIRLSRLIMILIESVVRNYPCHKTKNNKYTRPYRVFILLIDLNKWTPSHHSWTFIHLSDSWSISAALPPFQRKSLTPLKDTNKTSFRVIRQWSFSNHINT